MADMTDTRDMTAELSVINAHPCYSQAAHVKFARIHLPVAPLCNIGCKYCIRALNKVENRPGVASAVVSPEQGVERVREAKARLPLTVVGIAGPGDALANPQTFSTFAMIEREFPELMKCVSTNGLALADSVEELKRLRTASLTVTVNAVKPETAANFYDFVVLNGKRWEGLEAARILLERQKQGILAAVAAGMVIKINSVLVPQVNDAEIPEIAQQFGAIGVQLMNIMPLIPLHRMADYKAPDCVLLRSVREAAEKHIPQFRHCKQCRADAVGIPGFDRKDHTCPTEYFHF
jgi:nitrogen fixation protein NifB